MMKRIASRVLIALMVCALSGSMALAKVKSRTVTFGQDFVVGETMVKKGTYKLNFDTKTGQLTITGKNKEVVASTTAHEGKRESATFGMELVWAPKGDSQALVSVAFPGESSSIVLGTAVAQR